MGTDDQAPSSAPRPDADECPDCGGWIMELDADHGVCGKCGGSFETEQGRERRLRPPPAGSVLVCSKCGNREEAASDSLYCDQCGASLQGVAPTTAPAQPGSSSDPFPPDGICPDCGGPVVEVRPNHGVCRKCGERLITPEAKARGRGGLAIALFVAAVYLLLWVAKQRNASHRDANLGAAFGVRARRR